MVVLFFIFSLDTGRTAQQSNTSVSAIIIYWWGTSETFLECFPSL